MLDKIEAARKAGYSDDEIIQHLSGKDAKFKAALDAGYSSGDIIGYFSKGQQKPQGIDYRAEARKIAQEEGVDPDLFDRVISAESSWNHNEKSKAGAIGLGQLMPGTAKDLGVDPTDPLQNLRGSARYLAQQLKAFGSPELALAAYNAGPGTVRKSGNRIPNYPETIAYVEKITGKKSGPTGDAEGYTPGIDASMVPNVGPGFARGVGGVAANISNAGNYPARLTRRGLGMGEDDLYVNPSSIDQFNQEYFGADPNDTFYKAGKLGGEIVATAPIPGALGGIAKELPYVNVLANSITSGGMRAQGANWFSKLLNRSAGGAISGGASVGAIEPNEAYLGAAFGAAFPVVAQGVASGASGVGNFFRPAASKYADKLANFLGMSTDDLSAALAGGRSSIIPEYKPTVAQVLQNPEASQLTRTLKTSNANALFNAEQSQQRAYFNALEDIAQPNSMGAQEAAVVAGDAIENAARPARDAAKANVSRKFNAIESFPGEVQVSVPLDDMIASRNKFIGPGTFGTGAKANQAVRQAEKMQGGAVSLGEIQNFRSSIGEAAYKSRVAGSNKEAAALEAMKADIDNRIAAVASGKASPGEVFPPEAVARYKDALASHASMKNRFERGPQQKIFRTGSDGDPLAQGAEIPGLFFNGKRSQVNDMQAFKRLVADDQSLIDTMKQYAITEGVGQKSVAGNLGDRFVKWAQSRSGANKTLFSQDEVAKINEVARLVERGIQAENLARVTGSDTAQKFFGLKEMGLVADMATDAVAQRVPAGRYAVNLLKDGLQNRKRNALAELMADPDALMNALASRRFGDQWLEALVPYTRTAPALISNQGSP